MNCWFAWGKFVGVRVLSLYCIETGDNYEFITSAHALTKVKNVAKIVLLQAVKSKSAYIRQTHRPKHTYCVCLYTFKETEVRKLCFVLSACQTYLKKHAECSKISSYTIYNSFTSAGCITFVNKRINKCNMKPSVPCGRSCDNTIKQWCLNCLSLGIICYFWVEKREIQRCRIIIYRLLYLWLGLQCCNWEACTTTLPWPQEFKSSLYFR